MPTALPKISVITPSYNQAAYLERTILSVLDQGYPELEYIIIDGGSTDGSVDIIRKYADRLAYWVSEPDRGQSDAINKGLRMASGDWVAWQNSDDIFYPGTFAALARAANKNPQVDLIIGNMNLIDKQDKVLRDMKYVRPTYRALLAEGMVLTNQAAFWRRSVHQAAGYLDESLHYAFDYEWFIRVLRHHPQACHVNMVWGGLRLHEETKTSNHQDRFAAEMVAVRQGREVGRLGRSVYLLRRLWLSMMNGNLLYVARGFVRRLCRT